MRHSSGAPSGGSGSGAGARESNAGDEFHVLWAARRALRLLEPGNGLCRVVLEGLTPSDARVPDEEGESFLGVDLSEYLGGDSFAAATRVIVSQLKYSTRHPDQAWTPSRLCTGSRGRPSVFRRLARVYEGLLEAHTHAEIREKLRIRLTSNQPVAPALDTAISAAQGVLTDPTLQTAQRLQETLPSEHRPVITRLQTAAGLPSEAFVGFLSILELDSRGAESLERQRVRLIQEMGPLVGHRPLHELRQLAS